MLCHLPYRSLIDFNLLTFKEVLFVPSCRLKVGLKLNVNTVDAACIFACRVCVIWPGRTVGGSIFVRQQGFVSRIEHSKSFAGRMVWAHQPLQKMLSANLRFTVQLLDRLGQRTKLVAVDIE